jgi:hypothetical protein
MPGTMRATGFKSTRPYQVDRLAGSFFEADYPLVLVGVLGAR